MTSEPDSKPSRRPPTIELKATEVEPPDAAAQPGGGPSADASPPTSSGPPQPDAAATRWKPYAVGALVGAAAIVVIIAALRFSGFVPTRQTAAPSSAATETSAAVQSTPNNDAEISARLDKLERAMRAQSTAPGRSNGVAATEAQTKSLSDSLAALSRRLDEVSATSQTAAKTADAAQAAAEAAKTASEKASQSVSQAASEAANQAASEAASDAASKAATQVATQAGVQKNDLDALASRIAALENAVKALSENATHPAEGADDQTARLTIAAEALRATVERGAPYQAELAAVQSLGVAPDATTALQPFAATGVPTSTTLAQELATLAPDLRRASETPSGGSTILERLKAHARNLVQITPVDAPPGNELSAVLARIDVDAAHADIAAALNDVAALPEAAKPLAANWIERAKAREAALAASRKIVAAALAALSKPASQ